MISAILFIAACLALQAVKDAIRGRKAPTVSMTRPDLSVRATCGCTILGSKVTVACAAHRVMSEV